jgi:hypothetical protein
VSARKAEPSIPADVIAAYDRLIATHEGIERKGAKIPYTSVNGHMFSYLAEPGSLALRLPTTERKEFLERFGARLQEAYGIVQKEYVGVPDALLGDTSILAPYFASSVAYVKSLKPKPTRRG